jgi:CDP-diacylglycerol---serine O-phosphatidyltransferase
MNKIAKGIPSFITSLGLISGCISIVISISYGNLSLAGYFIILASIFDFFDGMAARALNAKSEFGKQLDSLADVVSFGVAPAMILYRLMLMSLVKSSPGANFDLMNPAPLECMIIFSTFLVAVFSALRLAKFNIDPNQTSNFVGLPTPANALFILALGITAEAGQDLPVMLFIFNRYFLLLVVVLSCYFLVSNINMFSLKFSSFGFRKNIMRYLFLLLSGVLLVLFRLPALAPVIVLYIVMSVINNRFVRME